jgi:hypothetical protein
MLIIASDKISVKSVRFQLKGQRNLFANENASAASVYGERKTDVHDLFMQTDSCRSGT